MTYFTPLSAAIIRNRRRQAIRLKYRRLRCSIIKRIFEYEDAGKGEQAHRILDRARRIIHSVKGC